MHINVISNNTNICFFEIKKTMYKILLLFKLATNSTRND